MIRWVDRDQLLEAVTPLLLPVDVLLDVGCGIRPQKLTQPAVHICADPYRPYLDKIELDHNRVLVHGGWYGALEVFPIVDAIYLLDVIEHIAWDAALNCLEHSMKRAVRQIVIFTPIGFLPQEPDKDGKDAWGMDGGHFQKHRSGWEPGNFVGEKALFGQNWQVIAAEGFHDKYGAFWAVYTK